MDPEALYVQLGRLIETMPNLEDPDYSTENQRWLGRAYALVSATGEFLSAGELKSATESLERQAGIGGPAAEGYRRRTARSIATILYRVLAVVELKAPASAQGAFIPAGSAFDALSAVSKVLGEANSDVLVVDPYMDEKALTDFAPLAGEGVSLRLLSDKAHHKPTLPPATQRWITQYGAKRPLQVKLAPPRTLHDRLIIVDNVRAWILTQSLNAFAARAPASIVRSDGDAAVLKIEAYKDIWQSATPI